MPRLSPGKISSIFAKATARNILLTVQQQCPASLAPALLEPHKQPYSITPGGGERRPSSDSAPKTSERRNAIPGITEAEIADRLTGLGLPVSVPPTWSAEHRLQTDAYKQETITPHYRTRMLQQQNGDHYTLSLRHRGKLHKHWQCSRIPITRTTSSMCTI